MRLVRRRADPGRLPRGAFAWLLWALALAMGSGASAASEEPGRSAYFEDSVWVSGSATRSRLDSTLRFGVEAIGLPGSRLDLERTLGLDDEETLAVGELRWRLSAHHRLSLRYLDFSRSGRSNLSTRITFGDQSFAADTAVATELDTRLGRLAYGWSLVNAQGRELGLSLGLQAAQLDADIATGRGEAAQTLESEEATVGYPSVGVYGAFALGPDWVLDARLAGMQARLLDYDVKFLSAEANLRWLLGESISFFVGYELERNDFEARDNDFPDKYELDYQGPRIGVSAHF